MTRTAANRARPFIHISLSQRLKSRIDLILTFATASLGFALALVKDEHYQPCGAAKGLWIAAVLLLSASIALGIWCILNRLASFRATVQNARDRERLESDELQDHLPMHKKEQIRIRLECRRIKTDELDKRTRMLFYSQIAAFGAGVVA